MNESTRAFAYLRVSGDEQADRGLPIAGQRESIARYAEEHHLRILRWFVDEARSGSSDAHRDAFRRMMREAHEDPPPADVILIWSWSRFARDQNDAHYWKASLRRHGVQIRDVDGTTPSVPGFEYVLESLIHWRDEQRLHEITHEARRGQQTLAQHGYVPSGSRPPRGYRVEFSEIEIEGRKRKVRRWVPDAETWPMVKRAWQMRLAGASYREIWRETRLYKSPPIYSTFFKNTIYKGELWFGGTLIRVEPVVTEEEWAKVNDGRRQRRSGAYSRRQGSPYLLSGLLRCARCGSALVGHSTSGGVRNDGYERQRWTGYLCPKGRRGECDLPRVTAKNLEQAVTDNLLNEVLTQKTISARLREIRQHRESARPEMERQLTALYSQRDEVERQISRLVDAIEKIPAGTELVDRFEQRRNERDTLDQQISNLEAELQGPDADTMDVAGLREMLREALEKGDRQETRRLLTTLIEEIVVDGTSAKVRYRLPFAVPTGL